MKIIFSIVLFFSICSIFDAHGQEILRKRAALIAMTDFMDGNFIEADIIHIDSLMKWCSVSILKSDLIYECTFLKIKLSSCNCHYYMVYDEGSKRFFKLSGFKNSEFGEFYNRVILSGGISFRRGMKNKEKQKYVFDNFKIENIDLQDYYKRYYHNHRNSAFDTSSCYRKSIITAY